MVIRATYKGKGARYAFLAGIPARDLAESEWDRLSVEDRARVRSAQVDGKPLYDVRTDKETAAAKREAGPVGDVDTRSPGDPERLGLVAPVRDGASVNEPGEAVPPPNRGERETPTNAPEVLDTIEVEAGDNEGKDS